MDPSIEMSLYSHSGLNGSAEWAQFCGSATQRLPPQWSVAATKCASCRLQWELCPGSVELCCTLCRVWCGGAVHIPILWVDAREEGRQDPSPDWEASAHSGDWEANWEASEHSGEANWEASQRWKMQRIGILAMLPTLTAFLAAIPNSKGDHPVGLQNCFRSSLLGMELFSLPRREPEQWKSLALKILRGFPELDIISVTQLGPFHARCGYSPFTLMQGSAKNWRLLTWGGVEFVDRWVLDKQQYVKRDNLCKLGLPM